MTKHAHPKWTRERVIAAVQRYAELIGETPSASRVDTDHQHLDWLPPHKQVEYTLGVPWNDAMALAGLEPRHGMGRPRTR